VQITELVCLWYGSFRRGTVRVILVCDDKPRTRDRDDRGYGLPLVTTDLESSAEDLVARYASRWGIEQAFADARHIIGVGEARNRTRRAVVRPRHDHSWACWRVNLQAAVAASSFGTVQPSEVSSGCRRGASAPST
jgi:hypothetical protein